jgi:phosphoglycolate phosphatase
MINTLVFDFDGTIADTFNLSINLVNSVASRYNFKPFDSHDIDRLRSQNMRQIFRELNIPLLKAPLIINDLKKMMRKQIASQLPVAGIPELMHQLKKDSYSLDIITSNTVDIVSLFLKKHNLSYFDHIYSDKSLFGKHVVIKKYLKKHQINPKEVIYIGDEIRDIEAAHKAGLKIISVTWGFNSVSGLTTYGPDYLAHHPQQVITILKQIHSKKTI